MKETFQLEAILNFGLEDGGTTIYGRRVATAPSGACGWTFWSASSGFGIDDNGEEVYVAHRNEETTDLMSLWPDDLFCYRPFLVHPEFATVLREALDQYIAGLKSHEVNAIERNPIKHWERLIAAADQKAALRLV